MERRTKCKHAITAPETRIHLRTTNKYPDRLQLKLNQTTETVFHGKQEQFHARPDGFFCGQEHKLLTLDGKM